MSVPDFQSLMLPVLKICDSTGTITSRNLIEQIIEKLNLSEEQVATLLPSKTQRTIDNRCYWALVYLQRGGLLERIERGRYRITDEGRNTVASGIERVNIKYLEQYPKFREFRKKGQDIEVEGAPHIESLPQLDADPVTIVQRGYRELRATVAGQILDALRLVTPLRFEHIVIQLLQKMGYGVPGRLSAHHVGGPGDGGIDGEIYQDALGLDRVYIQAKRYQDGSNIGRPPLQQFVGSLTERRSNKGVFITTSDFSPTAVEYIERVSVKIVLIDGERLAELMFDYGLGVSGEENFTIKKLDLDFFENA